MEHTDQYAREDDSQPDLASIILADPGSHDDERPRVGGYDARGVVALAVVVGVLAVVIGWTAFSARPEPAPLAAAAKPARAAADQAKPAADATPEAPVFTPGVQLAPQQLRVSGNPASGLKIRGRVGNLGTDNLIGGRSEYLVLYDGQQAAEGVLTALDGSGGSTLIEDTYYGSCADGVHTLVLIVDPSSHVAEADETDNAITRGVTIRCGG